MSDNELLLFSKDAIQNAFDTIPQKLMDFGFRVLISIVLLLVGLQLIKLIRKIFAKFMKKIKADQGVAQFLDSFIRISLVILLIIMIARSFGVDAATIVAIIGSAGLAIGLALQGSLSNLAGGILILLMKPFVVGDYISEDGSGKSGTVTNMQIFYTTLTTFDGKIVVIPNGALANHAITNFSTAKKRRVDVLVGISYQSDIKLAKQLAEELMKQEEMILQDEEKVVFVGDLGESSVNLNLRFWTEPANYFAVLWKMTEEIKLLYDEHGVSIPFPQMDLHIIDSYEQKNK